MPTLLDAPYPIYDTDLLRQLIGRRLCGELRVLAIIGAHRYQEARLIGRVFPHLQAIYLFEPLAEPLAALQAAAAADPRIRVFPVAISDHDGTAQFHVTSNDGESSSLLSFGTHEQLFPEVQVARTIEVATRRLDTLLAEQRLEPPDALLVDVQGAEYQVLGAMPAELLARVRLIYAEVSTERVYASAGLLPDIERLLAPRFVNLGFAALRPNVPMHGNVVFVAADDVPAALAQSRVARLQAAWRGWRRARRERQRAGTGAA
ncbi:MAG: FkbM family methyltransferase [Rubrivivax sp.]|nr:FkbM family methyltransferase [Rubrivivax sp.]